MQSRHDAPGTDYWASGTETGASSTWSFHGAEGIARLSGPGEFEADDPAAFSAELTRIQLDHVALERFSATAHRWSRTQERIDRYSTPLLTLVLLEEGRMHVRLPDCAFELGAGECMVIDSRTPFGTTTSAPVRAMRSVVGVEHLQTVLRRGPATVPVAVPRSLLTDSFTAFVRSVLETTAGGQQARGVHVIQAVADLQSAVLAEAEQLTDYPTGPVGLRYQMRQYIDANYSDPALDATAVADALHISVRHAHAVFDDGERTIARFIRDRRVGAVALELRATDAPVRLTDVARRHGFGSHDTLARAFRARFGMTPTDYREGGHRTFG